MFKVGSFEINERSEPFVIAEAGINHNGELEKAFEMIQVAKDCGANAIKFQTFKVSELIDDKNLTYTYMSQGKEVTESMIDLFTRYEFSKEQWVKVEAECKKVGIHFLSTPQNYTDLELLLELGMDAVKIGSDDFNNIPLIRKYRACGKPLILSCGMADLSEIHLSLQAAGFYEGHPLALLLCISQYPTPPEDINLKRIESLKRTFPGLLVGFSDHSQGYMAASLSVALGARIIEKHFTLDKNLPGPDHWFSENPEELKAYVDHIRLSSTIMGKGDLFPSPEEYEMRKIARRSVVAGKNIAKGEVFRVEDLSLKRPGTGLAPILLEEIVGKTCARDLEPGEQLKFGDFTSP